MATRQNYHHGNLREALLTAAAAELEATGHESLSLRALAHATGVSAGAPYRHFADRDSLLMALVETGFDQLLVAYRQARDGGVAPASRLEQACRAYIAFAVRSPQLFRLMFMSPLSEGMSRWVDHPSRVSFQLFESLVGDLIEQDQPRDRRMAAVDIWSAIHGVAVLRIHHLNGSWIELGIADDEMIAVIIERQIKSLSSAG